VPVYFLHKPSHRADERRQFPPFGVDSAEYRPSLRAFALPIGAPGDVLSASGTDVVGDREELDRLLPEALGDQEALTRLHDED
jgi:hypothetical protein